VKSTFLLAASTELPDSSYLDYKNLSSLFCSYLTLSLLKEQYKRRSLLQSASSWPEQCQRAGATGIEEYLLVRSNSTGIDNKSPPPPSPLFSCIAICVLSQM
jgi:hypothetical protein